MLPLWLGASDAMLRRRELITLLGCACRPPGQGRREPVAGRDLAADGGVAGGLRRLAEARPLGTAIRVRVGGRSYLQARMEDNAECMLVLIGATPEGKKELVGFQTGVRESAQSWRELLIDAYLRPCVIELCGPREPCRRRPPSSWCSTRQRRSENMAAIKWRKPVAESRPRRQIKKRTRGH